MQIEVGAKITLRWMDDEFESWLAKNYTIPNPEYITRARLHKWMGGTPKTIPLYTKYNEGMATIPYGCLREILAYLHYKGKINSTDIVIKLNKDKKGE